jgi:hypothetical protein
MPLLNIDRASAYPGAVNCSPSVALLSIVHRWCPTSGTAMWAGYCRLGGCRDDEMRQPEQQSSVSSKSLIVWCCALMLGGGVKKAQLPK